MKRKMYAAVEESMRNFLRTAPERTMEPRNLYRLVARETHQSERDVQEAATLLIDRGHVMVTDNRSLTLPEYVAPLTTEERKELIAERILQALREAPNQILDPKDLGEITGVPQDEAREIHWNLVERGKTKIVGSWKIGLVA